MCSFSRREFKVSARLLAGIILAVHIFGVDGLSDKRSNYQDQSIRDTRVNIPVEPSSKNLQTCPLLFAFDKPPSPSPFGRNANGNRKPFISNISRNFAQQGSNESNYFFYENKDGAIPAPRIVGGASINPNLSKYLALLLIPSSLGTQVCTGTIVGNRSIITAAHCEPNLNTMIRLTGPTSDMNDDFVLGVRKYKIHPRYRASPTGMRFDIAYIETDRNIPKQFKTMQVNSNPGIPGPRSALRVAGYGAFVEEAEVDEPGFNPRRELRQVDVPVVDTKKCNIVYDNLVNPRYQVCAGYLQRGGCDSCQGDSGGPLLQYNQNGKPVLVGVVSIGIGCAQPSFPGIYIRTSAFIDWIPQNKIQTTNSTTQTDSGYDQPTPVSQERPSSGPTSTTTTTVAVAVLSVIVIVVIVVLLLIRNIIRSVWDSFRNR